MFACWCNDSISIVQWFITAFRWPGQRGKFLTFFFVHFSTWPFFLNDRCQGGWLAPRIGDTHPVWCSRSHNWNRISTSNGVIWDIICAEWRNLSEAIFHVIISHTKKKSLFINVYSENQDTFGNFFESMAIRRVEINTFNELHIIQEGIERHKIWKADFATSTLPRASRL